MNEAKEKDLLKNANLVTDKDLLKIQVLKKKFVDQMRSVLKIPDEIANDLIIVGWYRESPKDSASTYEYILFKHADKFVRIDLHVFASINAERMNPDIFTWNTKETETGRTARYREQTATSQKEVNRLMKEIPQIFTE